MGSENCSKSVAKPLGFCGGPGNGGNSGNGFACCMIMIARLLLTLACSNPCRNQARLALLRSPYSASPSGVPASPLLLPVKCNVRNVTRRGPIERSLGTWRMQDPHSGCAGSSRTCAGRGADRLAVKEHGSQPGEPFQRIAFLSPAQRAWIESSHGQLRVTILSKRVRQEMLLVRAKAQARGAYAGNFGWLRVDGERRRKESEGKTDGGEVRDKPPIRLRESTLQPLHVTR